MTALSDAELETYAEMRNDVMLALGLSRDERARVQSTVEPETREMLKVLATFGKTMLDYQVRARTSTPDDAVSFDPRSLFPFPASRRLGRRRSLGHPRRSRSRCR